MAMMVIKYSIVPVHVYPSSAWKSICNHNAIVYDSLQVFVHNVKVNGQSKGSLLILLRGHFRGYLLKTT